MPAVTTEARHQTGAGLPARSFRGWLAAVAAVVAGGGAIGLALMIEPIVPLGLVMAAVMILAAFTYPSRFVHWTTVFIAVVLAGYAMFGRGFAHLGYPPLFVGEVALAVGVTAAALSGKLGRVLRSPIAWVLLAFMAWGVICTVPYLGTHGMDALRDAALWGYAVFTIIVAALLLRTAAWHRVVEGYAAWMPWLLVYLPFAYVLSEIYGSRLPTLPGSTVDVLHIKPGDVAVHLAGAGAFILLGLWAGRRAGRRTVEWGLWVFWLATFMVSASQNRGGMVSIATAFLLLAVLRPSWQWLRIGVAGVLFIGAVLALDVRFDLAGRREVSARQLAENAASVFGYEPPGQRLLNTVEWRTLWWRDIVDYTLRGPHFWTGKGYGINLANADGYRLDDEGSLRSPHNGHLTVLARSGVPGLVLWGALHATFFALLLRAYFRARRRGEEGWAVLDLWILAYWTAFMVNASFDVFLEGPQGGIWFWSLMGVGLAAIELQREGHAPPRAAEEVG